MQARVGWMLIRLEVYHAVDDEHLSEMLQRCDVRGFAPCNIQSQVAEPQADGALALAVLQLPRSLLCHQVWGLQSATEDAAVKSKGPWKTNFNAWNTIFQSALP